MLGIFLIQTQDVAMMNTETASQENKESTINQDPLVGKKQEILSGAVLALRQALALQQNPEEKLKMAVDFMKQSLAQEGTPRFKDFWDAKNLCLPLFKEKMSQSIKEIYWSKYLELATEAKRLKQILEEQSSFALEQIELALQALAEQVQQTQHATDLSGLQNLPKNLPLPQSSLDLYNSSCGWITRYTHLTSKLKALREEVIRTEMRVRHKNRFLKQMSELADIFIPKKKKLIQEVSQQFIEDVEHFVNLHLDLGLQQAKDPRLNFKLLREQIQALQEIAKKLSLSAQAFTKSRQILSQAWDLMKILDKEKKKEFSEKKALQQQLIEQALDWIDTAVASWKDKQPVSMQEIDTKKETVLAEIEKLDLSYSDKKWIRAKLFSVLDTFIKPFEEKKAAIAEEKHKELLNKNAQLKHFKDTIRLYIVDSSQTSYLELTQAYQTYSTTLKDFVINKTEAAYLESLKKDLYETVLIKRENELEQDQESLKILYLDWESFKEQTRNGLELYRKEESLSGFDFEQALIFKELKDLEKARLDRIMAHLKRLDDQLD